MVSPALRYDDARGAIEFLERYGSREFSSRDPGGNAWSFGTYDPFAS
jgi:uncharacterized glyoxalase superfamily protein PhnB